FLPARMAGLSNWLLRFGGVATQAAGCAVAAVDAADHRDSARAHELDDAEWPHQVDEGFDLFFLAGDFNHYLLVRNIDDAAAEDVGKLGNFRALARLHLHLDEHEVALDMIVAANILDPNDGDDFFERLGALC